jgi:3-hydroxy-3-methylglutaryl CoA synthase
MDLTHESFNVIVSEYPIVDGHHSMTIYMNAMKQCYLTLR